ncbi:alpha/beta fold hydrolase [Micromonospora echinaurantiaca]|uniref:alpha/beta fold hydrolase n=1 Tax=Micromonospora TaxID=1873 RepID=UPI000D704AC3|nr:alpha/beta hydrolase [Micromonospora sp. S4605]PWU50561.1 alpha/beta hydrolase [Micromonospora sp. S4605]
MTSPQAHLLSPGTDTGPCAVFVHGIEDTWRTWTRLSRCLGPQWRTVALDLPWRAGNDYRWRWSGGPGDWVGAGLEALGDRPFLLVGHSFGANAVLARLAAGEPRATAAVLAAPFFRPAEHRVTWETFDLSRETFQRQISDGMRLRLRRTAPPDVFEVMIARTCERIGPVGFLAVFEQYVASGHLPLSHVDIPAAILIGEADPGMFRPHMEALARRLPRATVAAGDDFDHFCHVNHAPEVARLIEELAAAGAGLRPTD